MGKNQETRKKLKGQHQALEEHLEKIAKEKEKPTEAQDQGLIAH
jgi:hypothetical protein